MECIFHLYSRGFSACPSRLVFGAFENEAHRAAGEQLASAIEKAGGRDPQDLFPLIEARGAVIGEAGKKAVDKLDSSRIARASAYTFDYVMKNHLRSDNFIAALKQVDPSIGKVDLIINNAELVYAVHGVQQLINEKRKADGKKPISEDGAFGKITHDALKDNFLDAYAVLMDKVPPAQEVVRVAEKAPLIENLNPVNVYKANEDKGPFTEGELVYLKKEGGQLKAVSTQGKEYGEKEYDLSSLSRVTDPSDQLLFVRLYMRANDMEVLAPGKDDTEKLSALVQNYQQIREVGI